MARMSAMAFAIAVYAVFFATFLYLIAFVGNLPWVPVTVDRGGAASDPLTAALVDGGLIALFGLQHSGMARQAFKRWWTGIVPAFVERSIYVLVASLVLVLLFAAWRPIGPVLWSADGTLAVVLWPLFALGWGLVLLSTFLINHFELFGLQQAWLKLRQRESAEPQFRTPFLYRLVRHPMYLGFFIAFWATPTMTAGHLLLSSGMSIFMFVAIWLEERDLVDLFGDRYREYRRRVGMLVPGIGRA